MEVNSLERILIVDDEYKIAEVIEAYLNKDGFKTKIAGTGRQALSVFNENKIDLIILDLMLPDISGEEVCKIIKEKSNIPIIMLTAKGAEESILNGFSLGADDYVTKPFSEKELVARVKAILKRTENLRVKKNNILTFNNSNLVINYDNYEVKCSDENILLTPSEFKILWHLAINPNKVFTRRELLDIAINDEGEVYDRIIDSHIKNIRAKIETDSKSPKYILTIHGVGYKFVGKE